MEKQGLVIELLGDMVAYAERTGQPDLQVALMYAQAVALNGGCSDRAASARPRWCAEVIAFPRK